MNLDNLDYAVIGNCRSAALISKTGSIDWCCLPDFNSPSVFASLLDPAIGGSFGIEVEEGYDIVQSYIRTTNVVSTIFTKGENRFEIIDFMPRYLGRDNEYVTPPDIIRYIRHFSGKPRFKVKYNPKLEYAKHHTATEIEEDYIKS